LKPDFWTGGVLKDQNNKQGVTMNYLRKLMTLCAFIAGIGTTANLMAADGQQATENQPNAQVSTVPTSPPQSAPATQAQTASQPQAATAAPAAQPESKNQLPEMGADALSPAKAALKRDAICTSCHDESETAPILSIYQTKHGVRGDSRTPTCQSCHGESEKHVRGEKNGNLRIPPDVVYKKGKYAISDDKARSAQCLTCHKGSTRTNWEGSQHQNNQVACNSCHVVHSPTDKVRERKLQTEVCFTCHKEQRADSHKMSTHPIDAGKVICSDCHNPHGSNGPKLLKKNTVTETCYTCHAEKRGPFLWAHQPVTEDCTNCHTPHGSNITPLLKSRPPFMCQECHDGSHASGTPVGPNAASYQGGLSQINAAGTGQINPSANNVGNACMNCHRQVHGSNSPDGAYLQR
jgi:DmsE family decaheme c-type cytochrome